MLLKLSVLFFTPLLSGLLIYLLPKGRKQSFRLLLVFAGSYLFAITITHILPELYMSHGEAHGIGVFVLLGFFLQQVLEYFSAGVEHGHIHTHEGHSHKPLSSFMLLVALCIHAFLEGGLLAQPATMGPVYDLNAILLGIALHRAPAAFALMAVLTSQLGTKKLANTYLLVFSLAAPVGLLISTYFVQTSVLSENGLLYLYALVSGNFLHISTTIVFESSPDHRFNARKLAVAMLGAASALAIEYFI